MNFSTLLSSVVWACLFFLYEVTNFCETEFVFFSLVDLLFCFMIYFSFAIYYCVKLNCGKIYCLIVYMCIFKMTP